MRPHLFLNAGLLFQKMICMKNFSNLKHLLVLACWALALPSAWSQAQTPLDIALRHIEQNHEAWGLTDRDVADMAVNHQYASKHNGVSHIYFIQRHEGIEVYNAVLNVNILPNGQVLHVGKRFIPGLSGKVNAAQPALTPWDAIQQAASQLGYSDLSDVRLLDKTGDHSYRYSGGALSQSEITVTLRYQPLQTGAVRLAWDLAIQSTQNDDYWSVRIDALTGELIHKTNWTVYCRFEDNPYHNHDRDCREEHAFQPVRKALAAEDRSFLSDGAVYHIFPLPVESPAHGSRILVTDPADPAASPFGWHDVDGDTDPDFTYTRGNNVHAYKDGNADGQPDFDVSGGAALNFDFPYNADWEPAQMDEASVTNLFYMNNMLHDITYHLGFDEEAGNFQTNTYGNGGAGNDAVNARGQRGGDDPEGLGAINNANFATPPDGASGTMNMFLWANSPNNLLEVTAPAAVVGFYETGLAQFGPAVADQPVSGQVVEVNDGIADPFLTDGCEEPFVNASELAGKIALIDRGGCLFQLKALHAEQAGAIGVIICNFEDGVIGMAGSATVDPPTIPTIMISSTTCDLIRGYAGTGLEVTIAEPNITGPSYLSGDYDNGIIAHEYAHGISNRLTAGPFQTGCLGNEEQMGEGWSDFFSLILTVQPDDDGADRRGIGTYVLREPNDGRGIRNYPYSTDFNENPVTYKNITEFSVPHGVGSVWASMLWDLYWAFVDEYGFDADLINGNGGNKMAIQLVMDGMKMQPCEPGFIDGRDAILAADQALFGGANQCLIWEVFASRGLGYFADQGSPYSRADGVESFEPLPTCIQELKIAKEATAFIQAGDEIEYTISVVNHKPVTATNVVVTDELPAGVSYIAGSANFTPAINGNALSFDLGDLPFGAEVTITYKGSTDPGVFSTRYFIEQFEDDIFGIWGSFPTGGVEGPNLWTLQDLYSNSPSQSFFVENIEGESQQVLQHLEPQVVQGDQPVLRFYHWYETEQGYDGGYVEVSTDGGNTWINMGANFFRNPYVGPIDYGTFTIPNLSAFSGNSGGFIASYADLSEYAGQEVLVRFKFGTDTQNAGLGWYVDDVELMDMVNYNSEACISSDEGDFACASAPSRGTIVDSQLPSSVVETLPNGLSFSVFPNPVQDVFHVQFSAPNLTDVTLRVISVDGKELMQWNGSLFGTELLPVDVSSLAEGLYMVQVITGGQVATKKVTIH